MPSGENLQESFKSGPSPQTHHLDDSDCICRMGPQFQESQPRENGTNQAAKRLVVFALGDDKEKLLNKMYDCEQNIHRSLS